MTAQPPAHSTRLENLRFASDRAIMEIDGNVVELAGEKAAATIQAFQSFYQEAYRAYGTAPEAAPARGERPPWWQRLRGWLARWLEGGTRPEGSFHPEPNGAKPVVAAEPKADAKARRASATVEPAAAKGPVVSEPVRGGAPPMLMAAFADEKGVHLLWNLTPGGKTDQIKERTYGLDSPVAVRLQECYGKLAEMGYEVVDLKLWQVAPQNAPSPENTSAPAVKAAPRESASRSAAPGPERIVRLLPADGDHPTRVAVAPVDGDRMPVIFSETARKVAALHAAADPLRPLEERLTFLSCTLGPKDVTVRQYGVGEDAANCNQPKDWKDIALLWPEPQKNARAAKADRKAEPKPADVQPGLFPA